MTDCPNTRFRGLSRLPGRTLLFGKGALNRALTCLLKPLFHQCGRNVRFQAFDRFSFGRISLGNDVYIGPGAKLSASDSFLRVGNKVQFGPNVTIMAGDHNVSELGKAIFDMHEARPEDNLPVEIDDDVWVGAGATILKGCRIGRGAIVAAAAVVTKSVPPYAIVVGVPARVVRFRWAVDEILRHERELYPEEARLSRAQLEQWEVEPALKAPTA